MSADTSLIQRNNNLVFAAILITIVLSFFSSSAFALSLELGCRAAIVLMVVLAVLRFRRAYFSHWTSWAATAFAALSAVRLFIVMGS